MEEISRINIDDVTDKLVARTFKELNYIQKSSASEKYLRSILPEYIYFDEYNILVGALEKWDKPLGTTLNINGNISFDSFENNFVKVTEDLDCICQAITTIHWYYLMLNKEGEHK